MPRGKTRPRPRRTPGRLRRRQSGTAGDNLPLQNFTVAANIGRLYLHEVAITNFQTTVKLDGGHVQVKPFQLVLNGAPVNASVDLDLNVPGYKYNLTA